MKIYTNPKSGQIINVKGEVRIDSVDNNLLKIGEVVDPGTVLIFEENSEVTLSYSDGSQQRVSNQNIDLAEDVLVDTISKQENVGILNNSDVNSIQDEISAIQALIASGEDVELPETAAGLVANEGTDFVSLDRTGDETLAQAGYETTEINNNFLFVNSTDPEDNGLNTTDSVITSPSILDDNEVVSTAEDTPISGNVLDNATSTDAPLSVTGFTIAGVTYAIGSTAVLAEGELTLNADGSYSFVPNADYNGPVPVISYTVVDAVGDVNNSTLTISVTPVNDAPLATDDSFSVEEGGIVTGNIISHDDGDGASDHDGGDGSILLITQINGIDLVFDVDGNATVSIDGGILIINAQGDFTYENSEGFVIGSGYPSFDYTLSDGTDIDIATVTITVDDTSPVAVDDNNYISYYDNNGLSIGRGVQGNIINRASSGDRSDSSADGTIILTQIEYAGQVYAFDASHTSFTIVTDFGTLVINDSGAYIFRIPSGIDINTFPPMLEFTYTIQDGDTLNPETDDATLTINLNHRASSNSLEDSTSSDGELIDLSYSEQSADVMSNPELTLAQTNYQSVIEYDLSDLLVEENNISFEESIATAEGPESSALNLGKGNENIDFPVDDLLTAENVEPIKGEFDIVPIVTNGFLDEGAILISDAAPENTPLPIDLDSTDTL
tara:strand:+ start:70821 stop:72830 length:2010 start_codon:yes stop_codon:yes gene_type:complete